MIQQIKININFQKYLLSCLQQVKDMQNKPTSKSYLIGIIGLSMASGILAQTNQPRFVVNASGEPKTVTTSKTGYMPNVLLIRTIATGKKDYPQNKVLSVGPDEEPPKESFEEPRPAPINVTAEEKLTVTPTLRDAVPHVETEKVTAEEKLTVTPTLRDAVPHVETEKEAPTPPAGGSSTSISNIGIVAPPVNLIFEIKIEDETLYLALRRWAVESKYQLVWDAGKDFAVKKTSYESSDIVNAVEQVMADTERSSYPLHACTYRNNVIRVLHISQPCERR
jgi:hypothetical protein